MATMKKNVECARMTNYIQHYMWNHGYFDLIIFMFTSLRVVYHDLIYPFIMSP